MTDIAPQALDSYSYDAARNGNADLNDLLAQYDAAKDAADAAKARLDEINTRIKAALTGGFTRPDGTLYNAYHLSSDALVKPLHLRWTVSNRVDTKELRATFPEIAERFTRATGTWVLARDRK